MYFSKSKYKIIFIIGIPILLWACSTKKNTRTTRMYHEINTRYNIYFNANESYKEALKAKQESYVDTLSQIINIFPLYPAKKTDSRSTSSDFDNKYTQTNPTSNQQQSVATYSNSSGGGSFTRSVEKTTKAIKLHSIRSKPERNPGKMRDPGYKLWLQQQEFNPFLHNAWLLLGKSEYQDGDYIQAISTFAYITRLYKTNRDVVAEARLWTVKANVALGWMYEAEDILNQIRLAGGVPDGLKHDYNKIYADFLIKQDEYAKAIPYLEQAIDQERDRLQRTRMKYLLGQLYKREGNREMAYKAFDSVHGLSTPYFYSFNARIQQASFVNSENRQEILSQLDKMSRDHKNKEYLDQVFYAKGNIFLNEQDTAKAIENYKKSIEKNTRNGFDKAMSEIILGDIYFTKRDYIEAQPLYSNALNVISKNSEFYPLVALRSSVLDELVVYVQAVHLQDSLQTLARMPEAERLIVINKLIEDIKKKEKKKKADREALLADREQYASQGSSPLFEQNTPNIPNAPLTIGGDGNSSFYFYSPQLVTQGKATFQRKWGMRKPEDNWRRKNKQTSIFEDVENRLNERDSVEDAGQMREETVESKAVTEDIYSPDFYIQQIPMTPEAIDASNAIIEDAYFNMGLIYKDKLGDYNLAIDAFETNISRFPDSPNLEEIYYQLFLIYLRLRNAEMTEAYRLKILNNFPKGSYAVALADIDYEWNMRNMYRLEGDLYQQTYDLYMSGHIDEVRKNYQTMKTKYPLSDLMPKFMFLNAMTYAQTNDATGFKSNLNSLITAYPKADVTPLATEMLRGIMSGKQLSSDTSPFRGMIWDIKFGGDSIPDAVGVDFVVNPESEYILLFVYTPGSIDKNEFIYEVANYNFSNYIYQTFDLGFSETNALEMLQVRSFKNLEEIVSYIDKAFVKGSLMSLINPSIIPIPISVDNYIALMNGKTLNEYFIFFEKNHTKEMLTLIRYWNQQRERSSTEPLDRMKEKEPSKEKQQEKLSLPEPPVVSQEAVEDTIAKVEPQIIPISPILPQNEKASNVDANKGFGVGDILSDEKIDKADDLINKASEIINNPLDGLKNILKPSEKPQMTNEEKKEAKEFRKLQKQQQRELKEQEKARNKARIDAEKNEADSIQILERQKVEAQRKIKQTKENEAKALQKSKEKTRKDRERELKEKEQARKEEIRKKEKERKERLKQRERDRKEKLKERERELKEKEKEQKSKRKK